MVEQLDYGGEHLLDSTETREGILVPTKVRQGPCKVAKVPHLQNILYSLHSACVFTFAISEMWGVEKKLTGASGVSRANNAGMTPQSIKESR